MGLISDDLYFSRHEIYPDKFRGKYIKYAKGKDGYRAPCFYMHGELEAISGYDCANFSPELLSEFTSPGIHIATVKFPDKDRLALVFCNWSGVHMEGYIVDPYSERDIIDAMEEYGTPIIESTQDKYIKEYLPNARKLIREFKMK